MCISSSYDLGRDIFPSFPLRFGKIIEGVVRILRHLVGLARWVEIFQFGQEWVQKFLGLGVVSIHSDRL